MSEETRNADDAERHYRGTGNPEDRQAARWSRLPIVDPEVLNHPSGYLAPEGLVAAVNVALELGMPLLLTGEPGCGKSRLAYSLAWELGFPPLPGSQPHMEPEDRYGEPLRFAVKSDTESRDLFYRFDTLGRFHAAHSGQPDADARRFVTYQALGKAILIAKGRGRIPQGLLTPEALVEIPEQPQRTVVLIDEIDKAPREIPNDILTEIEDLSFQVPELFQYHTGPIRLETAEERANRPVVVITSNSERDLPEAFLRRCVFYHLELPPFDDEDRGTAPVTIRDIVLRRLGKRFETRGELLDEALALFRYLRQHGRGELKRLPSLAELLNWLDYLGRGHTPPGIKLQDRPDFRESARNTLFKSRDDQYRSSGPSKADVLIDRWLAQATAPR